ncbi:MAG: hypothetical protein HY403_09435 [Elusimicrobia bacterium]|nr:hypothetical protein [Elusimicrobiota bacterium]
MKTFVLVFSASFLLGARARAESPAQAQIRLVERDLREAFLTGRPSDPLLLDHPALKNPGRLRAEERSNAESLIRLARQVRAIQAGTDGGASARQAQLASIREAALLYGMPPEPVVKMYLDARRAASTHAPPASAAAGAMPAENKARMARLMDDGAFGAVRESESGPAGAANAGAPPRTADFRPALPRLDIKGPPEIEAAPIEVAPKGSLFDRFTADYAAFFKDWAQESERSAAPAKQRGQRLIAEGYFDLQGLEDRPVTDPEWRAAKGKIRDGELEVRAAEGRIGFFGRYGREIASWLPFLGTPDAVVEANENPTVFNTAVAGVAVVAPFAGKALKRGKKGAEELAEAAGKTARGADGGAGGARAAEEAARLEKLQAEARVGVGSLRAVGIEVTPELAARMNGIENTVAKLNSVYIDGYHAASHQIGKGSVGEMGARIGLPGIKKPEHMSPAAFDELRARLYLGGLVHDVETVTVMTPKNGSPFIRGADPTKRNPIELGKLGAPIETKTLPDGTLVEYFAKAKDSQSNMSTTLYTIKNLQGLKGADDPVVMLVAMQTSFAPQERALSRTAKELAAAKEAFRKERGYELTSRTGTTRTALEERVRRQYGKDADAVLGIIDDYGKKLGAADVLNHYVRDPASAWKALRNFAEVELKKPELVNLSSGWGFWSDLMAKDARFAEGFAHMPGAERAAFARNLISLKAVSDERSLVAGGIDEAVRIARHPRVDAVIQAKAKDWPAMSFRQILDYVAALDTKALVARTR